jgi:hypothetical protein
MLCGLLPRAFEIGDGDAFCVPNGCGRRPIFWWRREWRQQRIACKGARKREIFEFATENGIAKEQLYQLFATNPVMRSST